MMDKANLHHVSFFFSQIIPCFIARLNEWYFKRSKCSLNFHFSPDWRDNISKCHSQSSSRIFIPITHSIAFLFLIAVLIELLIIPEFPSGLFHEYTSGWWEIIDITNNVSFLLSRSYPIFIYCLNVSRRRSMYASEGTFIYDFHVLQNITM